MTHANASEATISGGVIKSGRSQVPPVHVLPSDSLRPTRAEYTPKHFLPTRHFRVPRRRRRAMPLRFPIPAKLRKSRHADRTHVALKAYAICVHLRPSLLTKCF
jgi:hypothetical protein